MAIQLAFLLPLLFGILLAPGCVATPAMAPTTLLQMKSSLIDPEGILSGWSPEADVCSWHGVSCLPGESIVVGLNLSGYGLSDTVSPAIGGLISVEFIDLSSNSLTGPIPPELGMLQNLKKLLLYSNFLTGTIPVELGLLENLNVLRIGDNRLHGEIPPHLGNCTELEMLALAYCVVVESRQMP